jgi:hypothetical protein
MEICFALIFEAWQSVVLLMQPMNLIHNTIRKVFKMKQYNFSIYAQKAEFYNSGVGVAYGSNCTLKSEDVMMTLKDAVEYLKYFSSTIREPHAAFLRMKFKGDRLPKGFNKSETRIYGGM